MNADEIHVSVIDPIGQAFEKVKTILFRPFDLGKWFIIGFCAWLANLCSGGGGGGGGGRGGRGSYDVHEGLGQAKHFVLENLHWIIPVAVVVVVFGIVVWLFLTWLSSRGRFMFLHCVAQNKAEVSTPWTKFRQHANSLFLFRIVLGLIGFVAVGLPILLAVGCIVMMIAGDGAIAIGVFGLIIIGLIILVGAIIFGLISKFTMDFVVPIMFLRTTSCTAGWREFLTILSVNKGHFLLYILFQIVIGIAIGAIKTMGFCIGCCLCCVSFLLLIPYIGTVILLPIHVFTRSYSLLYLKQFGPEFDVFSSETENLKSI
ncbi:MAG: hypothetical protein H8D56_01795 [Planctomycetes bacterium]|nr:hypothetical protein [Planctomycetota bacterium]MBL7146238.1 hypothetical protein [Phycisphaerae bacterium]